MGDFVGEHDQATAKSTTVPTARDAGNALVRRYSLEAAWPSNNPDHMKALVYRLTNAIADLYGRKTDSLSIEDLERAQAKLKAICGRFGVSKIRYSTLTRGLSVYQSTQEILNIASHIYSIGSACVGNFGPIIQRYGLKVSGSPLARSAGVWLAGQVLIELYIDEEGYKGKKDAEFVFNPLFDSLTLDQLRELALHLNIDARVKWNEDKLRSEILGQLSGSYYNKVQRFWSDLPTYREILLNVVEELKIPNTQDLSDEQLEERVVAKVFAESVKTLTPEDMAKLESTIRASTDDTYWGDSTKAALMAGGLIGGNLAGFGLYVAASSGLAALGQGLGIGFAFSTYTTLSSALSVVFGPVGIGAASIFAAFQITKPKPKQAIPFILYMAIMRSYLQQESAKRYGLWRRFLAFFRVLTIRS